MDMMTLAMAKAYADSQRLAYEETVVKTLTWDGDTTGKTCIGNYYKVSDVVIDLPAVAKVILTVNFEGYEPEEVHTDFKVSGNADDGVFLIQLNSGALMGTTVAIASDGSDETFSKGTYLYADNLGYVYVSSIEGSTTVTHPVDPRFLPAGGVGYEEAKVTKLAGYFISAGQDSINVSDVVYRFEDGKTYPVTVNGKTYEASYSAGSEAAYLTVDEIGFSLFGTNGGDRICSPTVYCNDPNGQGTAVDRHIVIETRETVTHTIEPKFLPGVCLPVVEVESTSVTALTEAQNEVLLAAAQNGIPIVLCINNSNWGRITWVLDLITAKDTGDIWYFAYFNCPRYSGSVQLLSTYTDGQRNGFTMTFSAGA